MQPPPKARSYFFNYKHIHSIVLLAAAGPDYESIYDDVGRNGRVLDGGRWNKCSLSRAIDNGDICLPRAKCLPFGKEQVPFIFVRDDDFALKTYPMKTYPQSGLTDGRNIYNYRHSRARRLSENLFGIIYNKLRPTIQDPRY